MFLNPVHVGSSFFIKSSDDTLCSNPFHPLPALVQSQVKMCRNVACEMYLRGKKNQGTAEWYWRRDPEGWFYNASNDASEHPAYQYQIIIYYVNYVYPYWYPKHVVILSSENEVFWGQTQVAVRKKQQ